MSTYIKNAIWNLLIRLRHPRGKRGYLHHFVVTIHGVQTYGCAEFYHYRLNFQEVKSVEECLGKHFGRQIATISITPLDEYKS